MACPSYRALLFVMLFSGIFILPYLEVYGKSQEKHLSGAIYYH